MLSVSFGVGALGSLRPRVLNFRWFGFRDAFAHQPFKLLSDSFSSILGIDRQLLAQVLALDCLPGLRQPVGGEFLNHAAMGV
jgi:hypothetical protein